MAKQEGAIKRKHGAWQTCRRCLQTKTTVQPRKDRCKDLLCDECVKELEYFEAKQRAYYDKRDQNRQKKVKKHQSWAKRI